MKRNLFRAVMIAMISLLAAGCVFYLTNFELAFGLDGLFKFRGKRQAPVEVVVIAMDETSEEQLGLGKDLTHWRDYHPKLVQELQRQGAALTVFDLQFLAEHPEHDGEFAAAMKSAGNVLVSDCVQKMLRGTEDFYGRDECSDDYQIPFVQKQGPKMALSDDLVALRMLPPTALLAEAVLDHAPFHLSNDAENATIREGWLFLDALAEVPTLPVLAWAYYLQGNGVLPIHDQKLFNWLTAQRRRCLSGEQPSLADVLGSQPFQQFFNDVLCQRETRYLDYYGKPQSIRMVSYYDVYAGKVADLRDKVVFIGKANRKFSPGKTDFFQTPLTDTESGRMAGVEIMATVFANLLEGRFLHFTIHPMFVLAVYGLGLALIFAFFNKASGAILAVLFSAAYVGSAALCFDKHAWVMPVALPLLVQLPVVWLLSSLWLIRDLLKERQRMLAFVRQVFPQWLSFVPSMPGQWYPGGSARQLISERDVYGICLATDIEGYTAVAAKHTAHEMLELLNAYYHVLAQPVSLHNGVIADVTGDAMMAIWFNLPSAQQRLAACLAALEMEQAVLNFNKTSEKGSLPTRIGLHEGDMTLGSLAAGTGSHYRAIGDTVNTASRIQGVNKYLGTQILASTTLVSGLKEIVYRPVGTFILKGREAPIALVEIIDAPTDSKNDLSLLINDFASALRYFQQGDWLQAKTAFQALSENYNDGPSRFYLELATAYQDNPPAAWDGVVVLEGK